LNDKHSSVTDPYMLACVSELQTVCCEIQQLQL